jgi:hypothetical protein
MTAVPLTDQQLRDRIAAAFERLDAHQWGYDHGFCEKYGVDPETDSFVDAAIAAVQPELDRLRAELEQARQQLRAEIHAHGQTIDERDHATDMADRLAAAIAPESVIGEHSGMNCPWTNALEYASEQAVRDAQPTT